MNQISTRKIILATVQLIHFFIDCFSMSYVFIFPAIYDIHFVNWLVIQPVHWGLLNNECLVSYIEKVLINPKYRLGSSVNWSPHHKVFYIQQFVSLKYIVILCSLVYVIYRNWSNGKTKSGKIVTRGMFGMALILYFVYFHQFMKLH